jgi:putative MATE family efflux protein
MASKTVASSGGAPSSREILDLTIPALVTLAAQPLMGLLDTALLGRVGTAELAALGAANALLNLLAAALIFLEYGTTARLARRFGAGDMNLLRSEAVQMGWLAVILGLALSVVFFFVPGFLLRYIVHVPATVMDPGATYLSIRAFGIVGGLFIYVGNGTFRGLQDTKTPLAITILMNGLNAVLDVILIFGWEAAGIPAFGIAGAAWATVAATWVGAVTFLLVGGRRLEITKALHQGILMLRWDLLRDLLGLARDLLLRTVGLQAALFMATRMAAAFGAASLAAHQVGWQLWAFLALLLDSLAIAGQALVGRSLGAGRIDHARSVGNRLCLWGVALGAVFTLIFLLLSGFLPRVFTDSDEVIASIGTIFVLLAWMQIPNGVLFVLDGLLIGASDMGFLRNSMVALGLFGVLTAWLGARIGGDLLGVWLGLSVFMVARLLVMGIRWLGTGWMK